MEWEDLSSKEIFDTVNKKWEELTETEKEELNKKLDRLYDIAYDYDWKSSRLLQKCNIIDKLFNHPRHIKRMRKLSDTNYNSDDE